MFCALAQTQTVAIVDGLQPYRIHYPNPKLEIFFQNKKKYETKKKTRETETPAIEWVNSTNSAVRFSLSVPSSHLLCAPALVCSCGNLLCCVFERFPARKYAYTLHRCLNTNEPTGMVVCAIVYDQIKTSATIFSCYIFWFSTVTVSVTAGICQSSTHSTFFRLRAQIGPRITWYRTGIDYMDRRRKH